MPRFKRLALLHHSAIVLLSICFVTTSRYLYLFIFITLFNKLCDDDDDDDDLPITKFQLGKYSLPRYFIL